MLRRHRVYATILYLVWIVLLPSVACALPRSVALENCRLDTWSVRDGLPPHEITSIVQSSDGFMYIGTDAGLLRFDGASFRTFNTHNTPGLKSDMIASLAVDHAGTLWIGTELGGAGTFENGVFERRDFPLTLWHRAWSLLPDPNGDMWIGMNGKYNLQRIHNGKPIISQPQPSATVALAMAPGGGILCARPDDGLLLWRGGRKSTDYVPSTKLPTRSTSCVVTTHDKSVWAGTPRNGLIRIANGNISNLTTADGLASNSIRCLYEDHEKRLWIGTSNGVSVWAGHTFTNFGKDKGLSDSTVNALCEDREGNLWVGTASGLNKFASTKLRAITLSVGTVVSSMPYRNSLAPDHAGNTWCAADSGLWKIGQSGRPSYMPVCLGYTAINGICTDGDWLWLWGTDQGRCVVAHAPITLIERYAIPSSQSTATRIDLTRLPGVEVAYCNTRIIVGIPNDSRLLAVGMDHLFAVAGGRVHDLGRTGTGYEFIARRDPSGTVWVGCGNGLVRILGTHCETINTGLPPDTHVLGIDATEPGCLWMATDRGIAYFSKNKSNVIGEAAGLPDTNLFEILRDGRGNLWLGYNEGLFWVRERDILDYVNHRRKNVPFHLYGAADGIRSFPATFMAEKSSTGQLWFCGLRGLTEVDPGHLTNNTVEPEVAIEDAVANGKPLRVGTTNIVQPGVGSLRVEYSALSYSAPEQVRFRYRLEGLEENWVDVGNRRSVEFTNLRPGSYRFVVVACNNDGVWNTTGASILLTILPHYYEAMWFRSLLVFAIGAMVLGAHAYRSRAILRRNLELEEKVKDRTSELFVSNQYLSEAKETLEEQNSELQAMQAELEAQNDELVRYQSNLAEANHRLEELATTDGLTGLKNHRTFQERLGDCWEQWRRAGRQFSIILLDVDKFKQYNDTYGHPAGDDVLRTVARILSETARTIDCVARYGGEEFVILSPDTDGHGAKILADRLRIAIESHEWTMRHVTASFGVATASLTILEAAGLVAAADSALYESKKAGRNCVSLAGELTAPENIDVKAYVGVDVDAG